MELTDDQKASVASWVDEGCGLSEIQKRLREQFGLSLTYMDVRFAVIDLGLSIQDRDTEATPPPEPTEALVHEEQVGPETPGAAGAAGVQVDVDRVVKPGAIVSGSVSFSDGKSGTWALDQFGRLALDVGDPAYQPSPEDLQTFQQSLQSALASRGF